MTLILSLLSVVVFDFCFRIFTCRNAVSCVPALFSFYDFSIPVVFIFICKSPRAARLKKTQSCILQNRMFFCKMNFEKNGVRLKGSPFLWNSVILICRVSCLCVRFLFPYDYFRLPQRRFSCTCVFLRFHDFTTFVDLDLFSKVPGRLRLKQRNVASCKIKCSCCEMVFAKWRAAEGAAFFVWIDMACTLSCFSWFVIDLWFLTIIAMCRNAASRDLHFRCNDFSTFASLYLCARNPWRLA